MSRKILLWVSVITATFEPRYFNEIRSLKRGAKILEFLFELSSFSIKAQIVVLEESRSMLFIHFVTDIICYLVTEYTMLYLSVTNDLKP